MADFDQQTYQAIERAVFQAMQARQIKENKGAADNDQALRNSVAAVHQEMLQLIEIVFDEVRIFVSHIATTDPKAFHEALATIT